MLLTMIFSVSSVIPAQISCLSEKNLLNLLMILKYLSIFQNQVSQRYFDAPLNVPILGDFGLFGLETTLSNAFCCANCPYLKKLIWTSLILCYEFEG